MGEVGCRQSLPYLRVEELPTYHKREKQKRAHISTAKQARKPRTKQAGIYKNTYRQKEVMYSDNNISFRSVFSLSSHPSLGLPLLLVPSTVNDSTLLTGADCGLLLTCPNHLSRPSLILLTIVTT
nr:hypothetical protein [Tanacetum cinerariifolium]